LGARETFIDLVGRGRLDIEFARMLDFAPPNVASIRAHLALNGPIGDALVAENLLRRFLLAPSAHDLECAYLAAHRGELKQGTAELVFSSSFDSALAPHGCHVATMLLHPVPVM